MKVVSLGGSVVVPQKVDTAFVKEFIKMVRSFNDRFIIVVGGGMLSRMYQQSAKDISNMHDSELDWIGIHATRLNAEFIRILFGKDAFERIVLDPREKVVSDKKVVLSGGWKPGWSTDYVSVKLAKVNGADTVINITKSGYLYDKDPEVQGAKKLSKVSWKELQEIVGSEWVPGLNKPFDPIASKEGQGLKLKIVGKSVKNIESALESDDFEGTLVF